MSATLTDEPARKRGDRLSFDEYMQKRTEEVESDFNRRCAREELGHEPNFDELYYHWETHGGKENFEKNNPW